MNLLTTKRLILIGALAAACAAAAGNAHALAPLRTSIIPNPDLNAANQELEFARVRAAGATAVNLPFNWAQVAPTLPLPIFDATDPADPQYNWTDLDSRVRLAREHGLEPILAVQGAPLWAQGIPPALGADGPYKPDPGELGKFARALAHRYSGTFQGLPRVRWFIAWNEPNIYRYLTPQTVDGKDFSPEWYRQMVNAFSSGVHAIHADDLVVAGALAPFGIGDRISPMKFMREMLCMSKGAKPHPTCSQTATFDVWSHHPYTRGDPFHHAQGADDVSLGDLPEMKALLDAAVKAQHVVSSRKVQFWVDEFSYNTRPPDTNELILPISLSGRYVAESLYQMWRSGVTLASWYLLRDDPESLSEFQSGLWFNGSTTGDLTQDWPKPGLTAFRFPFVAYHEKKIVSMWGRTPTSKPASVALEVGTPYGWRRLSTVRAGANGIFTGKLPYARIPPLTIAPAVSGSYEKVVKAGKPRSYWRLAETSGTVARDAMGRANGTYEGAPVRGVPGALKKPADRAVQFDGGSRVALPHMTPPRTIELWLRTKGRGAQPAISFRGSTAKSLYVGPMGGFARAEDGASRVSSFDFVNDGRWHYLVYTLGSHKAQLYVDGRLQNQTSWPAGSPASKANLAYDPLLDRHFVGTLDEVAVYNRALTTQQIARHYAASGRKIDTAGTLRARIGSNASWPFSLKRPPDHFVLPFG